MLQTNQQCPICQKTFKKSDFSLHLQFCLDRSERSNNVNGNNDSIMRTNSANVVNGNTVSSNNLQNNDNSTSSSRLLSRVNDTSTVNNNNREQRKTIPIKNNNNKNKKKKTNTVKSKISYDINDDSDDFQSNENVNNRKRPLEHMKNDGLMNEENKENNERDIYTERDNNNWNNWSCKERSDVYGKNVLHDGNNGNGNEEGSSSWTINQNVNTESISYHEDSINFGNRYSENNNNNNNCNSNRYENDSNNNNNNNHYIHIDNSNSDSNDNNNNKYFKNLNNDHINNQEISVRKIGERSSDDTKEPSSTTISNIKIGDSQNRGYTSHTFDRKNNGNLLYNGNCVPENIQNENIQSENIVFADGRNSESLGQDNSRLILKKDKQFFDVRMHVLTFPIYSSFYFILFLHFGAIHLFFLLSNECIIILSIVTKYEKKSIIKLTNNGS